MAIYDFYHNALDKVINTVIKVTANVIYTDVRTKKELFHGKTTLYIDTVADDKITFVDFPNTCFSEFMTRYQAFTYNNGVLHISGDGNGIKGPYEISVMG